MRRIMASVESSSIRRSTIFGGRRLRRRREPVLGDLAERGGRDRVVRDPVEVVQPRARREPHSPVLHDPHGDTGLLGARDALEPARLEVHLRPEGGQTEDLAPLRALPGCALDDLPHLTHLR